MSSKALRRKNRYSTMEDKRRRHTLGAIEKGDMEAKIENYKRLLQKENEIRNKLNEAKSELELSLPIASENLKSMYTKSISKSYSTLPRNKNSSLHLSLFSDIFEDAMKESSGKTQCTLDKAKGWSSGKSSISYCSSPEDLADPFPDQQWEEQRQKRILEILESRRAVSNKKAEKRRACLDSLDNDLIKAKNIIDKNRQKLLSNIS